MNAYAVAETPLMTPTQALSAGFQISRDQAGSGVLNRALAADQAQLRQGFHIGELNLMIRYEDGSELTDKPHIFRLPNTPTWFLGMSNLHGMLIPVLDLGQWFGSTTSKPSNNSMLLVLGHGAESAGLLINGLPQRLRFDAAQTSVNGDCVSTALRPFVTATQLLESQVWFDLNVPTLLSALELALGESH